MPVNLLIQYETKAHGHRGIVAQMRRRDLTKGSEGAKQLPNQLAAFSLVIRTFCLKPLFSYLTE